MSTRQEQDETGARVPASSGVARAFGPVIPKSASSGVRCRNGATGACGPDGASGSPARDARRAARCRRRSDFSPAGPGRGTHPGGFPSGQRGQTVNLMASPSQVRILLPPPTGPVSFTATLRECHPPSRFDLPSLGALRPRLTRGARTRARARDRGRSSMVERQPSKLNAWVRFPSPAPRPPESPGSTGASCGESRANASVPSKTPGCCSSVVEHFLGKEEVMGSSPISSSISPPCPTTSSEEHAIIRPFGRPGRRAATSTITQETPGGASAPPTHPNKKAAPSGPANQQDG